MGTAPLVASPRTPQPPGRTVTAVLWIIAVGLAACAAFCISVGGWLGWSTAALFGYYAVDMARFAMRMRRRRIEFDEQLAQM